MSNTRNWTVLQVLQHASDFLSSNKIENARLNAERLLSNTLHIDRIQLYLNYERPLTNNELQLYKAHLKKRSDGVPLQYITGKTEFMSLPFEVNPAVLIPRPETETLVEITIDLCQERNVRSSSLSILDIGTGSGCIAVSLAHNIATADILAIDKSPDALSVATRNAEINGVADRIHFQAKDILQDAVFESTFDVIVSNPPYVSSQAYQELPVEIKEHEPAMALLDGADGLTFYHRFAEIIPGLLQPGGVFVIETGDKQAAAVQDCFENTNFTDITIHNDLNGIGRVVICKL